MEKKILSFLLDREINCWEMASMMGPMNEFVKELGKMRKNGLVKIENANLSLTTAGREISKNLKIFPVNRAEKNNYNIVIDKKLLEEFKKLRKNGLFKEEYDQLQLLPEAVVKKIEIMKINGDIKDKKIICLGDDDMTAIALALTKLPLEIAVLDIDDEVIEHENKIFEKLGVNAKAYKCNLVKFVPAKFKNNYDVFITEPPDTVFGNSFFFSRGIECIKKSGGIGYLGISETDFSREGYLEVEKNILKTGSLITDIFKKFEPYEIGTESKWVFNLPDYFGWPQKPWFFSDVLRTEILKGAKPLFSAKISQKISKKLIKTNIYC